MSNVNDYLQSMSVNPKDGKPMPNVLATLTGSIAEEYWEGAVNITKTFPAARIGFSIVNDGASDLTFTINGVTRKVKSGEGYNNRFNPFTQVVINTSSAYRAEVMS